MLLTGAGGSIGRVLAKKLLDLKPAKLVLVDFSEFNLFRLEQALRKHNTNIELVFKLLDVRNSAAVDQLLDEHTPHVIFQRCSLQTRTDDGIPSGASFRKQHPRLPSI